MEGVTPATEVETIKGVVTNFDWELVKQTITKEDITLVIRKPIKATEGSESK